MPFPFAAPKKIRDRMDNGTLPVDRPEKMHVRFGQGNPCKGCDQPIIPAQVEYEFGTADGRKIRFHLGCAGVWEAERRRRGLNRLRG